MTVIGALVVNKIPIRRGPIRFKEAYNRVSPIKMPIRAEKARMSMEWLSRVRHPPVIAVTAAKMQNTIVRRMRLKRKAPKARVGVVDNNPPKDQQRAAAKAEHSAIYICFLGAATHPAKSARIDRATNNGVITGRDRGAGCRFEIDHDHRYGPRCIRNPERQVKNGKNSLPPCSSWAMSYNENLVAPYPQGRKQQKNSFYDPQTVEKTLHKRIKNNGKDHHRFDTGR
jgi:hypothetical protein